MGEGLGTIHGGSLADEDTWCLGQATTSEKRCRCLSLIARGVTRK